MTYQHHQLNDQLVKLKDQIRELYSYIASEAFIRLPEEERELLIMQLEQMQALYETIQKRVSIQLKYLKN
jgi:chaperone required for assembly of F1-ATPase